ncbi:MAG: glycosyltransferase [Rubripirellula sp.]
MDQSCRLSVVVPTHGRVELFLETLESLQKQTLGDFELVVTDDSGAPEDRQQISDAVDGYREQTGRIAKYVFTTAKLGQAANTNQGLASATGQILRMLHSDDLVRPECFEWEVQQFDAFPELELLFQDCLPFHRTEEIQYSSPLLRLIEPSDYFRQFLSTSTGLPSGTLMTAASYQSVGGMRDDWAFLCDWELFAKLLLRAAESRRFVGYATAGNFAWRLHDDSTTTTKWQQHYTEHADLMKQWQATLPASDLDLFVNEADQQGFFWRGEQYRESRLMHDVSGLSWSDLKESIPWIQEMLPNSRGRKIISKARRRAFKRKIRAAIGKPKTENSNAFKNTDTVSEDDTAINEDWSPEFVVTPMHGDPEVPFGCRCIVAPYDNSFNLWQMREHLGSAQRIRLNHPNFNRFYRLIVAELLKYIAVGAEVEFSFHDNQHMTWFGLKAVVDMVAPGRFQLVDQTKTPVEGSDSFSKWTVRYQCLSKPLPWNSEPLTGVSIGVLTLGDRMEELTRLIETAREHCKLPYEIILVSPKPIESLEGQPDIRQIIFTEKDDLGWITRKKNLICQDAKYSELVICHDRFEFTTSFFQAYESWGCAYGIAAVRLQLPDGKRGLDWGVVRGDNFAWCEGGLLNYRDNSRFSYVPGGVTMLRKSFWEQFPWSENLFWNEHEDVELCRRVQRTGETVRFFPGLMIATRDRWVDENPLLPYSDQQDL